MAVWLICTFDCNGGLQVFSSLTPQVSATHASLAQDIVPIRCYSQKEDVTQVAELEPRAEQSGTFCFSCGRKIQDSGALERSGKSSGALMMTCGACQEGTVG